MGIGPFRGPNRSVKIGCSGFLFSRIAVSLCVGLLGLGCVWSGGLVAVGEGECSFFLLCLCSCLPFGVQILIIIIVIEQEKRTPALHQEQWTGVDRDLTATGSEDHIADTWIRDLYRFGLGIVH